jgi:hypothetical protein
MGRSRVVQPEMVRLPLSDGDFIDVKRELTAGEYYDLLLAQSERQSFAKILAYVIGWSLVGANDAPIPYSLDLPHNERRDTVRSLDTATVRELTAALDKHEAAVEAARAGKKTTPAGTATPSPSFVSVS